MRYTTSVTRESVRCPGVRYTIRRISYAGRLELLTRVRDIGARLEFLRAGETWADQLEAARVSHEIDRAYLEWALLAVEGLQIDGAEPEVTDLWDSGPAELIAEVIEAIRHECGLSDNERKN
jgi:hypothetical protein